MYEFDEDTVVEQVGPGVFAGRLTDRGNIGAVPNGGYVLAPVLAAVRRTLPAPDPLTVTAHYLRPTAPGAVQVHVETIKIGRQYSTASARLLQSEKEDVLVPATTDFTRRVRIRPALSREATSRFAQPQIGG